jgi:hypothetical protein
MDMTAAHFGFVAVSYALSGLCLVALCIAIFKRDRNLAHKLKSTSDKSAP